MSLKIAGKRLTYRARLTLAIALASALALGALFFVAVWMFRWLAIKGAQDRIAPALLEAKHECRKRPNNPELFEVTDPNPALSLGWFDYEGRLISHSGPLTPLLANGPGVRQQQGLDTAFATLQVGNRRLVGTVLLTGLDESIRSLTAMLAGLWLLMVGVCAALAWSVSKATFHPLTEMTQTAEALKSGNRLPVEGTDEYAAFAESLNRYLDRMEEAVKNEERFVADAAHELRTPLAILRSEAESALMKPRHAFEYEDTLRGVLSEARRLSALVDALLLSTATLHAKAGPLRLDEYAERAHARWADRFAMNGVALQLQADRAFAALSPGEFDAIVDNLLSNALGASPPGTVCVLWTYESDADACVEVMDEGEGVPEEMREKIFERFARGDRGRSRDRGGFGVGLSVCRRLVEGREGRIYVADSLRGARFVIELPKLLFAVEASAPQPAGNLRKH